MVKAATEKNTESKTKKKTKTAPEVVVPEIIPPNDHPEDYRKKTPTGDEMGIDQLVLLIGAVASFGGTMGAIFEDGKINWEDSLHMTKLFGHMRDFAAIDYKKAVPQAKDLDEGEIKRLGLVFDSKFDLENEDLEKKVEEGLEKARKGLESLLYFIGISSKIRKH